MAEKNDVTANKLAEENQVTKEPQRVTTKNPKKVEQGKRLAAHNRKKREEQRNEQAKLEKTATGVNQYYGIGVVIAIGAIGGLGYYIYRTKQGEQPSNPQQNNPKPHPQMQPQTNKFEMD